jgi:hypothetical protein
MLRSSCSKPPLRLCALPPVEQSTPRHSQQPRGAPRPNQLRSDLVGRGSHWQHYSECAIPAIGPLALILTTQDSREIQSSPLPKIPRLPSGVTRSASDRPASAVLVSFRASSLPTVYSRLRSSDISERCLRKASFRLRKMHTFP